MPEAACRVRAASSPAWLFDPQTSGGLLGAVPPEATAATLGRLREAGCPDAAVIGEVVAMGTEGGPAIILE